MKKIKTKMLLGFGVMTALVTTGTVIISCGSTNQNPIPGSPDQQKLNAITTEMVSNAIATKLAPNTTMAPADAPKDNKFTDISINGLTGVSITISGWAKSFPLGTISFSVTSIDKGNMTVAGAKFGTITVSGFQTITTLTQENVISMKDKLWTYDTTSETLNFLEGVTTLGSTTTTTGYDFGPGVEDGRGGKIKNIVFPSSLTSVGDLVFSMVAGNSVKFNGAIPGTSGRTTLALASGSLGYMEITMIIDGDLAKSAQWQAWATTNAADAFYKP